MIGDEQKGVRDEKDFSRFRIFAGQGNGPQRWGTCCLHLWLWNLLFTFFFCGISRWPSWSNGGSPQAGTKFFFPSLSLSNASKSTGSGLPDQATITILPSFFEGLDCGLKIKLDACITVGDVACRVAWKRREAEGTDMPAATVDVELAFMGPEELGVKRRRVDVPKYLCSRDLCGGWGVRVGSSEVLSLYVC